jgi:acetyl esterase/lipase
MFFRVARSLQLLGFLFLIPVTSSRAQQSPPTPALQGQSLSQPAATRWSEIAANKYTVLPDVVYSTQNNYQLKLDLWRNNSAKGPIPTLIYIHGGGWVFGDRTGATPQLFPYFERGWNIVNVEYRMAYVSPAPAAVEDCRCALRWVIRNAKQYNLDVTRIVVTGHSAGGHLSLTTGMLTPDAGLDVECPGDETLKVAAIVDWFGPTDVPDILQGPNKKSYAEAWLGTQTDRIGIAKKVSPLTYVGKDNPPTIIIHGDADGVVPYEESVHLNQALTAAGVPNELITIKGGGHGGFTDEEQLRAFDRIWAFLDAHLPPTPPTLPPTAPPPSTGTH